MVISKWFRRALLVAALGAVALPFGCDDKKQRNLRDARQKKRVDGDYDFRIREAELKQERQRRRDRNKQQGHH
jgi:hypothetical protein